MSIVSPVSGIAIFITCIIIFILPFAVYNNLPERYYYKVIFTDMVINTSKIQ